MNDTINVEVRRDGRRFEAEAVLELPADEHTVWDTITDYPALPRFMPGIRECRVLEHRSDEHGDEQLLVEQHGEFRFMLFAQSMKVRLAIEQKPRQVSVARALSFDLGVLKRRAIDVFEGRYELRPPSGRRRGAGVRLHYSALIGLRLPPPPAVGHLAVRQNLTEQLQAVAAEVGRRHSRRAAAR